MIKIEIPEYIKTKEKEVNWVDDRFVPCEELFPCWMTARIMLSEFCDKTKEMPVQLDKTTCNIGLQFPMIEDIFGSLIPMVETFPEEDRPKVKEICMKLMSDYIPNLDDCLNQKSTPEIKYIIEQKIKGWHHHILNLGGKSVFGELKFRLGITPYEQ